MKRAAAALAVTVLMAGFGVGRATAGDDGKQDYRHEETVTFVRDCYEDEPFLRGKGDYDPETDTWARYVCLHVDRVHLEH